jgi:myo-inositol catabolism protein IolS
VEYRQLGAAGSRVSVIGFGCWAIGGHGYGEVDDRTSIAAIRKAVELGVNLFDTADVYGFGRSERVLSDALGADRDRVIVATKFGVAWDETGRTWRDSSPARAREALEGSLRRLRLDRIPLYQVHWPDGRTPLDDTLAELERQRDAGKIDLIGVSNCSAPEIFLAGGDRRIASAQYSLNLMDRTFSRDISACDEAGIGVLAYGVLARGLFSGKFDAKQEFGAGDTRATDPNFRGEALEQLLSARQVLRAIADRGHATSGQIAIRWAIAQRGITSAIVGAKTPEQVDENVRSLQTAVSADDFRQLDNLATYPAT